MALGRSELCQEVTCPKDMPHLSTQGTTFCTCRFVKAAPRCTWTTLCNARGEINAAAEQGLPATPIPAQLTGTYLSTQVQRQEPFIGSCRLCIWL